jgi:small GTP-binding protein
MQSPVVQKKICLLGDFGVGKTSLVKQFVYSIFEEKYLSTIGVSISQKGVQISAGSLLQMVIWDLSGSEEFNGHRTSYLRGASGALLVCDLVREKTTESLASYREQLENVSPAAKFVIIGNKSDIAGSLEDRERDISRAADDLKAPYFITSAKTGYNVENAFQTLAASLV